MFTDGQKLSHSLKALLCCALTLSLHVVPTGCGLNYTLMDDGSILVPLGPTDALVSAAKSTSFARPISLRANPLAGEYDIAFEDGGQHVSGKFTLVAGRATLSTMVVSRGDFSAEIAFDSSQRLLSIKTSNGKTWDRPPESIGFPVKRDLHSPTLFEDANADLIFALEQYGAQGAGGTGGTAGTGGSTSGGGTVKIGQSSQTILINNNPNLFDFSEVLRNLGTLFFFNQVVPNLPLLLTLFQFSQSIQLLLTLIGVVAPGPGGPGTSPGGGAATLRVFNDLSGDTPIWFVTLVADPNKGLAGGNLLGEEAIPAGTSRDFKVASGTRDINVIVPSGPTCFKLHEFFDQVLVDGAVTEIVITDSSVGSLIPDGCDNG